MTLLSGDWEMLKKTKAWRMSCAFSFLLIPNVIAVCIRFSAGKLTKRRKNAHLTGAAKGLQGKDRPAV